MTDLKLFATVSMRRSNGIWTAKVKKESKPEKERERPAPRSMSWRPTMFYLPALQTGAGAVLVALAFLLLGCNEWGQGLYVRPEWDMWKLVAALSIGLSILLMMRGTTLCRQFFDLKPADAAALDNGSQDKSVPTTRGVPRRLHPTAGPIRFDYWPAWLIAGATAFVVVVVWLTYGITARDRWWPDGWMNLRIGIVLVCNAAAAVPWVVVVWFTHGYLRITAAADPHELGRLLDLWRFINAAVLAFGSFVVLALVPTAVLRSAYLAQFDVKGATEQAGNFPSTDVLLYGAFFAVASISVAFPLINSWRTRAFDLVERTYGIVKVADFDKDDNDLRTALQARLGLNIGILKSPLAAFTIFVPLVTTALAVFIPELAKS